MLCAPLFAIRCTLPHYQHTNTSEWLKELAPLLGAFFHVHPGMNIFLPTCTEKGF